MARGKPALVCPYCNAVLPFGGDSCANCGGVLPDKGRRLRVVPGKAKGKRQAVCAPCADLLDAQQRLDVERAAAGMQQVDRAVDGFRRNLALDAVGHFFREGRPGPPAFQVPEKARSAA
jgi:hypothetical protein